MTRKAEKNNNSYSTKEILNRFIENDFKEFKEEVKGTNKFIIDQSVINEKLLNFKKQTEERHENEDKEKSKMKWYKKDWFRMIVIAFLTALFTTIGNFLIF